MTKKSINVLKKKHVNSIESGTILKKDGDMFIVAKISEAQFTSVVDESLFGKSYNSLFAPTFADTPARRNPSEAKHVLISLSTGRKFFTDFMTLDQLLMQINRVGFEKVLNMEIREV
ncbi:hypothetical protein MOC30_14270 [Bacillus spizizenii]|nr:hypothetical protein [Bacillus spizizenii]